MDHTQDMANGSMDGSKSCPMIMAFHAGYCERILWNGWVATSITGFVFSALAIFVISFLYESLKLVREYFMRKSVRKESGVRQVKVGAAFPGCSIAEINETSAMEKIFSRAHVVQTILYLIQIILSYLLMLVFMTFNYWLCLAIVLGLGSGYFVFGWIERGVYESECCP